MRVIVTQLGDELMQEIDKETAEEFKNKRELSQRIAIFENAQKDKSETLREYSKIESPFKTKKVAIQQKKINIPKNIAEKYNNFHDESNPFLPQIFSTPNINTSKSHDFAHSDLTTIKNSYSI